MQPPGKVFVAWLCPRRCGKAARPLLALFWQRGIVWFLLFLFLATLSESSLLAGVAGDGEAPPRAPSASPILQSSLTLLPAGGRIGQHWGAKDPLANTVISLALNNTQQVPGYRGCVVTMRLLLHGC